LRRLARNRQFWSLITVIAILVSLINITGKSNNSMGRLENVTISFLGPIKKVFTQVSYNIRDGIMTVPQLFYLKHENEELKAKISELERYKRIFTEYQQENAKLRELLDLKEHTDEYELEAAEIIGRDPGNWFDVIIVDKGEQDGIKNNMALVTDKGLVGYVISTDKNFSKAMLLTDDRSSVSAMIQRTRDNGIVKGTLDTAAKDSIRMVYLPQDASLVKGDLVISSGLGGIIPKGIIIGEVIDTKKEPYELMQYALIKPAVDFQKLEYVFIIKNPRGSNQ